MITTRTELEWPMHLRDAADFLELQAFVATYRPDDAHIGGTYLEVYVFPYGQSDLLCDEPVADEAEARRLLNAWAEGKLEELAE